jgi:hypothetical protein
MSGEEEKLGGIVSNGTLSRLSVPTGVGEELFPLDLCPRPGDGES